MDINKVIMERMSATQGPALVGETDMTDQLRDYYVMEVSTWINDVEGLSDEDRAEGREVIARLLAHHDVFLHKGRVTYGECLRRAQAEMAP